MSAQPTEFVLPAGASETTMYQILATTIEVMKSDTTSWMNEQLGVRPGTEVDVEPQPLYAGPLPCLRCLAEQHFVVQGRWGDEITVICTRCGKLFSPTWADRREAALINQTMLQQFIVAMHNRPQEQAGDSAGPGHVGAAAEAETKALAGGVWTPTQADYHLAVQLVDAAARAQYGPVYGMISDVMANASWLDRRTGRFSVCLGRMIGVLAAPAKFGNDEYVQQTWTAVLAMARTIAALDVDTLPLQPTAISPFEAPTNEGDAA